jgi:hypothetical protein
MVEKHMEPDLKMPDASIYSEFMTKLTAGV